MGLSSVVIACSFTAVGKLRVGPVSLAVEHGCVIIGVDGGEGGLMDG